MDALERLGLTPGEVKVYTALLETGPTTTGRITRQSGVSSSKVYPILDRLISKGMVSYINKGRFRVYQTTSPERMLELLEARKAEIEKQEEGLRDLMPSLMRKYAAGSANNAVVYEGYKGVRSYFNTLLSGTQTGERLVLGARAGYPVSEGAQHFFRSFQRSWDSKGLKARMIFNKDLKAETGFFRKLPRTEIRFLPQVTPSSIGIHRDSVDILIWTKETVLLFAIKSKDVAETFRDYFELLWRQAR